VEVLVAEGHDPVRIAAAALKMGREEEKQRPIEAISEVNADRKGNRRTRKNGSHNGKGKNHRKQAQRRREDEADVSHEAGMVRLSLGKGRKHGIRPGEVVGTIAARADIPGYSIGRIVIRSQDTLVDVPEEYVSRVLGQTGSYHLREHRNVTIERSGVR
jgi:ATP-dependent RNA helicase DeaD